jgi:outer membrane biosynthesis protein TonB
MNSPDPAPAAPRRNWARRLVNVLVALLVIAVAGAAFVFSYDGVHAIALFGGMSTQLARYYPGLFDAVLVVACVAAVMLRDGRWWARLWAWVVIIVVLAAIGTTDVLHAMNYTLRHRVTEGVVAAAPVVAVLLAFSLLLTLLRLSRAPGPQAAGPAPRDVPALPAAISVPPMALPAAPTAPMARAVASGEPQVPVADPAARAPMPAAATVAAPAPAPGSLREDIPAPDATPARAEPVVIPVPDVPSEATPQGAHPLTESNEVMAPEVRSAPAVSEPAEEEPAPPTVPVPTVSAKPAAPPEPVTEAEAASARTQSIRYASDGIPGTAGNSRAAGRASVPAEVPADDYWDSEEPPQFAGLVYPARGDSTDRGDAAASDDAADDEISGADAGQSPDRRDPLELDDDAPPFATAPFASVPRLNRVRSMPIPPTDDDEDE